MGSMDIIEFESDSVKIRTGRVDGSATVSFDIGEYQLKKIKDLVSIVGQAMKVKVEVKE